jgi:acyl-CoA synthetase (AMP-forming)/AMP-acid ligase II
MSTKSEISGGPPQPLSESLFAYVEPGVHKTPDKLAVVSKTQRGDHLAEAVREATGSLPKSDDPTTLRWTFTEFFGVSVNLAENLAQKTAGSDAVMITFIQNSVEYLLLLSGSMLAKVGVANLDVGMLQKPRHAELEAYIRQLQPCCIVVPDAEGAAAVDKILQGLQLPGVVKVSLDSSSSSIQITDSNDSTWQTFASFCKASPAAVVEDRKEAARHDDPNRTALVVYTSGTSGGMPKGCLKHVASLLTSITSQTFNRPGSSSSSVRIVQTANFRAIAPLVIIRAWHDSATVVLSKYPFSVEAYLDDVEQEKATELVLIPAQLHAIAASPSLKSRDFGSVEMIGTGGDIVNAPLIKLAEQTFPAGTFMTGHGMSECSGVFQWPYWDGSDSIPFHQGISPVGRPSFGAKLRLVSEEGEIVPMGEIGELHVQHGSVFKGYLRERKDMPEFYTDESGDWFITGDLGLFSGNGDVYIVGRKKDVVKRAAVSIAPAAIESCLSAFAGAQVSFLDRLYISCVTMLT